MNERIKDMKKRIIMMIVGVALLALPATAQTFGTQQAEQPNAVFQSTSSMQGSGSTYSANPTLNSDGIAAYSGSSTSSSSGPRHAKKDEPWGTGTLPKEPQDVQPLGDAVLPLMLMVAVPLLTVAEPRILWLASVMVAKAPLPLLTLSV